MKKTLLLILFVLISITAFAQNEADIDPMFNTGTGFDGRAYSIANQPDNKIIIGGSFTTFNGASQNRLIRLNVDGTKDTNFNIGDGFNNTISSIAIQSDGKILVGGIFTFFNGASQNRLIRLNSDGTKDTSFDIGIGFNGGVNSIVIQPDGKILCGGEFSTFIGTSQLKLIRLNANGSKDTTFSIGAGFTGGSGGGVNSIAIQSDNKILVGGDFSFFNGTSQNHRIRLNANGSKDTSFNTGVVLDSFIKPIAIQSDGKILVGGNFGGTTQKRLKRFNANGSNDSSFDIGIGFGGVVSSIAIQSDGKILVGGEFTTFSGSTQNRLIRLNANGTKDTSFDIGTGFTGPIYSIVIQSDEKILTVGWFSQYKGTITSNIARLKGTTALSTNDFTKTKISLYPNPVKDILNVSLSENTSIENYEIYDLIGKNVISKKPTENSINVSELSNGIYVIKVITSEGVMTNKFIKE